MSSDTAEPAVATAPPSELCDQISRSVGSVWREYGGGRSSVATVVRGDRICCVLTLSGEPDEPAEADADAEPEVDDGVDRSIDSVRYRTNVMAAVRKSTDRRVLSYISKRDKTAGTTTAIFRVDRSLGTQG